ncbi:sugar MFS transporter [Rhizorhapis suberifaciens]|uniref:FHS family L-fucose permease-like MFS transporter n=1 Tax=Rhizorhapis suberifaciens TaxID=13656 RepID=A0A840HY66_9SPHN|nr:sugar MFS transporter [Rhizorhapis suberifaciens]MBB4642537.1 FHS family L-fucose permease-like MFS transporter [Rhizorhapis suberifaciens]
MAAPIPVHAKMHTEQALASRALVVALVALFFIWGGLTSLNDILIPKLKGLFSLSYTEAMLTQFAFFMAYFIVSLPAGALIARIGYLKGIVVGLGTMSAGCLMFVPASLSGIYSTFLAALFVLASGITILQVAANPLIANLGDAATSHSRLTLAQAFNSLGTTLFPPVGALIILGSMNKVDPATLAPAQRTLFLAREAAVIGHAYIAIAAILLAVALFFLLRRGAITGGHGEAGTLAGSFALLKQKRLGGGVISIFLYVGAEVAIGSMLVNYLAQERVLGLTEQMAGTLIAFYWGGAMVGRFIGAAILRRFRPGLVLSTACLGAIALIVLSATSAGVIAGYTILAVGLMNAIMFPTIFSLGVEGLGDRTPQGSGLLCMAIVGGALIPLLTGAVADATSLAAALAIPGGCYLLIAIYGWSARNPA